MILAMDSRVLWMDSWMLWVFKCQSASRLYNVACARCPPVRKASKVMMAARAQLGDALSMMPTSHALRTQGRDSGTSCSIATQDE